MPAIPYAAKTRGGRPIRVLAHISTADGSTFCVIESSAQGGTQYGLISQNDVVLPPVPITVPAHVVLPWLTEVPAAGTGYFVADQRLPGYVFTRTSAADATDAQFVQRGIAYAVKDEAIAAAQAAITARVGPLA